MYNNNNLQMLKSQLPKKPYCSDDLKFGLQIQLQNKALAKRYLQINNPAIQHSLIFDIDIDNCFFNFEKNNAPPPNIIIKNPKNGRCHYIYQLEKGIYKNRFASLKATKYAAAIESGLCLKLEADLQYVGLVAKNPFHSHWQTEIVTEEFYTLDYLADFVDLSKPKERQENHGLGRNCNLFDDLRQLAYRKKRNFDDLDKFFNYLLLHATNINNNENATNLLMFSEVKAITKSISKWCFKHFDVIESDRKFSKLQSHRNSMRKSLLNVKKFISEEC
ncbi:hypothetical protein GQ597_11835 [Gilliamella sp. Pra-s65]|uniref:replication initiation protein n=1 Tax=Gilliamella sp. Pra-s65 TaxID=2687316 RepID=UPI001365BB5A|nr:replication initiation protein [Gilliamella sp. Pra-s65]MWN91384.1 hypothetical protein [Gilliamella sp. Pra-s65]